MTSLLTFAIYTAEAQRRQPLAIVEKGLVSYWALDKIKKSPKGSDIVEDIIGENDGVVNGKPKVVEGKYDNALEFDGIKDFILLPTKNLNSGNQPMTATAWLFLKKKGPGGPAWHSVVSFGPWETGKCFTIFAYTGKRRGVNQITMTQCIDHSKWDAKGPDLTLKEWHHVAAVYGEKRNILYLDGVEVANIETPGEPDVRMDFEVFGGRISGGGGYLWAGIIDEVGFYNRVLTPEEVLKNATAPQLFAVEPGGKLSLTWAGIKAR